MSEVWDLLPSVVRADPVLAAIRAHLADPEVGRRLHESQAAERWPGDVIAELQGLGLAELFTDRATPLHVSALNALVAERDGSLAIGVGVNALALLPVHLDATPALRERVFERVRAGKLASILLTEWRHGSDLARCEARADRVAGGWRLFGEKQLINGGQRHDLLTVLVRTRPPSQGVRAYGDHTLVWLERGPGVTATARWSTLTARGADISGVRLDGVEVPEDQVIGAVGDGFSVARRTLAVSRGGVAALAAGAACAASRLAREHGRTRVLYGAPIDQLGAISDHLAELEAAACVATGLAMRVAATVNALGLSAAPVTCVGKLVGPRLAERAVDLGRRVLGARALLEDHGYATLVRDVLLYGVFDGTSHLMAEELAYRVDRWERGARADAADPIERVADLWARPPTTLVELGRRAELIPPPDPLRWTAALAERGRWSWLPALPELARSLRDGWRAARERGATTDQPVRFAFGEALAELEAAAITVELGDPGLADIVPYRLPEPAAEAGALDLASAMAARLRQVRLALGLSPDRVDEALAPEAARARHTLRQAI